MKWPSLSFPQAKRACLSGRQVGNRYYGEANSRFRTSRDDSLTASTEFISRHLLESVHEVRSCHPRACLPAGRLDPGIHYLLIMDSRLKTSGMTKQRKEFIL
jgi:hypothetical protein